MSALLSYEDFSVAVPGVTTGPIVDTVSLDVEAGEIIGVIGESGAGKSTTARVALGLWPERALLTGTASWQGRQITAMSSRELRRYRISAVAAVLQDPRASVNPMHRIEHFVCASLRLNLGYGRAHARTKASSLLESVGLDPDRVLRSYPHELSGGMLQRTVIATALAAEPELLVADEPTTALDVTSQAEVMAILSALRRDRGLAILLVTHNLELAGAVCDRLNVMRAGRIVEQGDAKEILHAPRDEYTKSLLDATLTVSVTAGGRT